MLHLVTREKNTLFYEEKIDVVIDILTFTKADNTFSFCFVKNSLKIKFIEGNTAYAR